MKLEFESNAVSSPLVNNQVPSEFEAGHESPEILQMLRDGIKAAQDGERAEARNLLLRVTEADPKNENAWLWLASISEYPEELLVFLNNVLDINPENERAIEWAKATKSLIAKTFVQRGIDASKDNQKKFAKQCFLQAIVHDSESELAWLWLASVTDSNEEKTTHLQKVLSINPENENALSSLMNAKRQSARTRLPQANSAAISGDRDTANEILAEIFTDFPDFEDAWMLQAHICESFDDKIAAFERVLEINPENPVARANVDSLKMFAADNANAGDASVYESVDSENEAADFDSDSVSDPVTEAYNSFETSGFNIEYHEEEAVAFEISEKVEAEAEASSEAFDEPEVLEMADSDEETVETEAEASFDSEVAAEPEEEPVSFDRVSEEVDHEVDHDYAEESIDASFESAEESVDETVEAASLEESPDFTEEEIAEFEADNEEEDSYSMEAEAEVKTEEEQEEEIELSFDDAEETVFQQEEEPVDEAAQDEEFEAAHEEPAEEVFASDPEEAGDQWMDSEDSEEEESQEMEASPAMPSFDSEEQIAQELPIEDDMKHKSCPYCKESNEHQAFACGTCKAIFTISDIEMILSHQKADKEMILKALEKMESNRSLRGVVPEELKHLGIGYINLKEYRKGFDYLQEAAKKDPNDVVLVSQIDALAVRLAEIEEHERDHEPATAGKRILIVDDSPTVRKLISGKLEKCGHEAICAIDGMDALAKINEVIPDLILLDITMPRMDGYQVCKLIRGNDATKDVPVVMISGKDGFFDKVRGRMAGTSNYITKPFGPETLMKAVNEYVQ